MVSYATSVPLSTEDKESGKSLESTKLFNKAKSETGFTYQVNNVR